ncbi:MAG TPA: DUF1667 domain-containing protein [Candidatus Omnitrophota bacterium]|nr:DUF1667 domain-containing protein [Candidatus Omnitrophota bacterium]
MDIENCHVVKVEGNTCPKGEKYAISEIENPLRMLTTGVLSKGLDLKIVPVRTDKPIPRSRIFEAMGEVKKILICKPVSAGQVIVKDFLGISGTNLIATRKAVYSK